MMDKIEGGVPAAITKYNATTNKIKKTFLSRSGIFIGSLICVICILTLTTDIKFNSVIDLADIGGELFVLMLSTYSMYITFFDSGRREGLLNGAYLDAVTRYNECKESIKDKGIQRYLASYCQHYEQCEIKDVRTDILVQAGISYDDFEKKYLSRDKTSIKLDANLSEREKTAIIAALKVKPINITPDMFLKRGRGSTRRVPLGDAPERVQRDVFIRKAITALATSLLTAQLAFDIISEPPIAMMATVLVKLLPVILNAFFGYKFGYDHITVNTVDYITDQTDFLNQFMRWVDDENIDKEKVSA